MATTIRRATESDVDAIAPLFDRYRQFYRQPADLTRAGMFLQQRLSRGESVVLAAEIEGEAVGFAQLYPMYSSVRTSRIWVLNDLYVEPGARRRGVARALLDAAAGHARDDGAVRIVLETGRDNAAARALYCAAGWLEEDSQWYALDIGRPVE